ncbi:MAG: hypothetical protein BWY87_00445 [Deltaproteobacteria bacterium ADurb.Bin510]|jgi:hypothetical protein|nr:MAG: hypothetical protein BWY87_00445 [Deltaproteobacteria bacterium ADurb.Bin510]
MASKHVARRRCVGCGQVFDREDLIRLVKNAEGLRCDIGGRAAGRGFYLCPEVVCLERALKRKHSPLSGQSLGELTELLKTALTSAVKADVAALERARRLSAGKAAELRLEVDGGAGHLLNAAAVVDEFPLERCFRRDVRLLSRLSSKGL